MAHRLINLRQKNNLSQTAVAKQLNVTPSLISAYEKQERNPSVDKLIRLADIYHTSTDYILGRTNKDNSTPVIGVEHLTDKQVAIVRELVDNMNAKTD